MALAEGDARPRGRQARAPVAHHDLARHEAREPRREHQHAVAEALRRAERAERNRGAHGLDRRLRGGGREARTLDARRCDAVDADAARGELEDCQEKARSAGKDAVGRIEVSFSFKSGRKASSVKEKVIDGALDKNMRACIKKVITRAKWPKPAKGTARVTQVMQFD